MGRTTLGGPKQLYQQHKRDWFCKKTCAEYPLEMMDATYKPKCACARSRKDMNYMVRTLPEHNGGCRSDWPQNVVKYASPKMKPALMGRYNPARVDHFAHVEELVYFACERSRDCPEKEKEARNDKGVGWSFATIGRSTGAESVLDSGASRHLVTDPTLLVRTCGEDEPPCVPPDGSERSVTMCGIVKFHTDGTDGQILELQEVYYSPGKTCNLVST
ncbi:TPA: LOW QUALITY PROTEIN: hypothetical protein N0F65_009976, partial [Lagenidium giganteum]